MALRSSTRSYDDEAAGGVNHRPPHLPAQGARRLERDPDAEEPEAPVVEVGVEGGLHPAAVVVERLMVIASLIDPSPRQVRRRRSPLGSTGSAAVIGSASGAARAAEPTRPARSATVVGPTGSAAVVESTGSTLLPGRWSATVVGTAGSALLPGRWSATVTLLLGRSTGTTAPGTATGTLTGAAQRAARRGTARLRRGQSGSCGEGRQADADDDGRRPCRSSEMHGCFPFEVS